MKWNGEGFDGLVELAVEKVNRKIASMLRTVLGGVETEKLQKHLDKQAQEAVEQAAKKMAKNKIARGIMAKTLGDNAHDLDNEELLELERKIRQIRQERGL
jgi:Zn-dependent M16 (insulinase) family peptidase